MRSLVASSLLALTCASVHAQAVEIGMLNSGPLATEVTHRMRPHSMPGAVYLGGTLGTRFTFAISATFTTLVKTRCDDTCTSTGRDYRPGRDEPIESEHNIALVLPRLGIAHRVGPVRGNAGLAVPILQAPYSLVGASPMLVLGGFAEIEIRTHQVAIIARQTGIPPQRSRWVALSEQTGYKQHGQDFPNGRNDPKWINMIEAGFRIYAR